MDQADALARQLCAEVGLPEKPNDAKKPQPAGPEESSEGIMAQMGRTEHAASQVAGELGSEQGRTGNPVTMPSGAHETAASIPDLSPSERNVRETSVPALADGAVADARGRIALAHGGGASPETSGSPQGVGVSGNATPSAPVPMPIGGLALKCLEATHKLLTPAARLLQRVIDAGHPWLDRLQSLIRPLCAFLGLLDWPFSWVPRSARTTIGYVALATLVMALLTFVVSWMR
ncbi:MAG: hypothetical protein JSU68_10960 [Phycisphaerales bacterium]|nr:MAG: hypothetical protein JSU68_10960 [Phycisphaerales bacterium]